MPISIPEHMLASRPSQCHKYLSHLSQASWPFHFLQLWASLPPQLLILHVTLKGFFSLHSLPPSPTFSPSPLSPSSPASSSPSSLCCTLFLSLYFLYSLSPAIFCSGLLQMTLASPPPSIIKAFSLIIPRSGHAVNLYRGPSR